MNALTDVLIDEQAAVMQAYGVWGTLSAILVASDGTVRSAPAAGHVAIEPMRCLKRRLARHFYLLLQVKLTTMSESHQRPGQPRACVLAARPHSA